MTYNISDRPLHPSVIYHLKDKIIIQGLTSTFLIDSKPHPRCPCSPLFTYLDSFPLITYLKFSIIDTAHGSEITSRTKMKRLEKEFI